jgi:chromosome segregation ATPase
MRKWLAPFRGNPHMVPQDQRSQNAQIQTQQIRSGIQKALELASQCNAAETSDNYEFLEEHVDQLEGQAREAFQAKLDLGALLAKLRANKPLTSSDLKTLELLIVGDAEYYLKYESEIEEWKAQLKRALDQIAKLQTDNLDIDSLMHLRALCREAHEAVADLVFYFDAQERVAKFRATTQGAIDAAGYHFLAEIVGEMLASDKM